jgi:hypothetical protein
MLYHPRPIDLEAFDEIKIGMAKDEVEAILGSPAEDIEPAWKTRSADWEYTKSNWDGKMVRPAPLPDQVWISSQAKIGVWYDNDGSVAVTVVQTSRPDPSWISKVRRRLGL